MKIPKFRFTGSSIINVVGGIIVVYLLVVLAQTVKRNYDLGNQIEDMKGQITQLQTQKDELSYNLQYYNTDSFRDREARSKLGLQLPGENVIIIPQPSARPTPQPSTNQKDSGSKSNFQQWFDFLSGRVSS
jgi:cell division protein FtsB